MEPEIPPDTLHLIQDLIRYQNIQLIKHIAKVKKWDEKELILKFIDKPNSLEKNDTK